MEDLQKFLLIPPSLLLFVTNRKVWLVEKKKKMEAVKKCGYSLGFVSLHLQGASPLC